MMGTADHCIGICELKIVFGMRGLNTEHRQKVEDCFILLVSRAPIQACSFTLMCG